MNEARRLPFEKGVEIINGLSDQGKIKDAMIFLIGLGTGLRVGDMLRVTWEQMRQPQFEIIEQKTRNTKKHPKPTIVHLSSSIREFVNKHSIDEHGKLRTGIVLVNRSGKPMSRINVHDRIKKWTAYYLGDGHYSAHSLRKGFGYHFYKNNPYPQVALQKLSERFHHSNQQVTLRYLGLDLEETREIIENSFKIELDF